MELREVLDRLIALEKRIDGIKGGFVPNANVPTHSKSGYQSHPTMEVDSALAKAQCEYPEIKPESKNQWHQSDYAKFDTIMRVIRPILAKNGLALSQYTVIDSDEGGRVLHTVVRHSSGQWLESRERIIPDKNDDQTYASTLQYKKRIQAMALLGITINDDVEDDDAEIAMTEARRAYIKGTALNAKYDPREESSTVISQKELEELDYELAEYPDIGEQILRSLRIHDLKDMPKSKFRAAIEQIRNITNARNGLKKT